MSEQHRFDVNQESIGANHARVELIVDDREQQLLTPVLRHFIGRGYQTQQVDHDDHIRLESASHYVIVRSELTDRIELAPHHQAAHDDASGMHLEQPGADTSGSSPQVVLSITASGLGQVDLRHAVGSAVTQLGGLAAHTDDPLDRDHAFHDHRGVRRAILRTPS